MTEARLPWTQLAPKAYQAMAGEGAVTATSTLGMLLIDMAEVGFYSERERAALAWAETTVPQAA